MTSIRARERPSPGMGRSTPSRYGDEFVIGVLIERLSGRALWALAREHNIGEEVLRKWSEGTSRRHCLIEAERRWKAALRVR